MVEKNVEEFLENQTITLKPKERITSFLQNEMRRDKLDELNDYQMTKENREKFYIVSEAEFDKLEYIISDSLEELFKILSIHPSYGKYFKAIDDNTNSSMKIDELTPFSITRQSMLNKIEEMMRKLSVVIPLLKGYMDITRIVNNKWFGYQALPFVIYNPAVPPPPPVQVEKPLPEIATRELIPAVVVDEKPKESKSLQAYKLKMQGKGVAEIGRILGVNMTSVPTMLRFGELEAIKSQNPPQVTIGK